MSRARLVLGLTAVVGLLVLAALPASSSPGAPPAPSSDPGLPIGDAILVPILPGEGPTGSSPALRVIEEDDAGLLLEFALPAIETQSLEVEDETFHVMAIPGGEFTGDVGAPMLPTYSRLIRIPDRAAVRVEIRPLETRELSGYRPLPVQPGNADEGPAGFVLDRAAYARAGYGESRAATIGEPALMRGTRVVPITFCPLRYDAVRATIEAVGRMQVRLRYEGVDLRNAGRGDTRPLPASFEKLHQQAIANYGGERSGRVAGRGTYVLIHPNIATVLSALQPLIEWRTRQGYEVHVASTAQTGATPEGIKAWLQNAYDTWPQPPEFITLVGDVSGTIAIPCWYETYSSYHGETDHLYTMLDGSDILPEAHIGRISVESIDQLNLAVHKIVSYESTPYLAETDWYPRACLCGDPYDSGYTCVQIMQWLKERLRQVGYAEVDTIFTGPFVSQMTTKLNRGDTIFGYRGIYGMSGFGTGNISTLTNGRKLPFAVILTCDTGSFANGTARSEAWLRAGVAPSTPTGGIASIGTATIGTHTRYNNCVFYGVWHAPLWNEQYRFGEALSYAKYQLYVNYGVEELNAAQRFSCWNNLMGDAAGELWTAVPQPLSVSHPAGVAVGTNAVRVGVAAGGAPLEGAYVCLWNGTETFAGGYTGTDGEVELPISATAAGAIKVTVTLHDHIPYLGSIAIAADDRFVGYLAHVLDDDDGESSSGNGDQLLNPSERIELPVQLCNYGTLTATGVTATLTCDDPRVTVTDAAESFGNIPPGGTAWSADDFDLRLAGDTPSGHTVYLQLLVTSGSEEWLSLIAIPVVAARFTHEAQTLYGFGARIDPGEAGELSVRIRNRGDAPGVAVTGTLVSESPWVTVTDASGAFGTAAVGGLVENTADHFALEAAAECFQGHVASLRLLLSFSDGARDTVACAVTVGQADGNDPTGPDRYGYYAFDNTDTGYPQVPAYQWIEIATNHGGSGTPLNLNDDDPEEGGSQTVNLPFPFQYYGETFTRATICSNGWIAMGSTYLTNYRNWNIPAPGAPAYMIAPMWDDLYTSGSDRVYHWHDAANHRYVVQWSRLRNSGSWWNNIENFEAILYDPAHYPTDTGDGMIEFQYDQFRNVDYEQHYCTVGIENGDRSDGIMYTYFGYYNTGAASIGGGRVIRFVPVRIENTAGSGESSDLPLRLALAPARPNPFGAGVGTLALRLELPQESDVRLRVLDAAGRLVRTLQSGPLAPGVHRICWDGRDEGNRPAGAGVYFSVLQADGRCIVRTLTLVR